MGKTWKLLRSYAAWNRQRELALPYALMLMGLSLSWIFWYRPSGVVTNGWLYASCVAEAICFFSLYLVLDSRLRSAKLRFLLAGVPAMAAAYMLIDTMLLWLTDIRLHHSVTILQAGGDFWLALAWAGFTPMRVAGILGAIGLAYLLGGVAHIFIPRLTCQSLCRRRALLTLPSLALLFYVAEQSVAQRDPLFHVRDMIYPGYVQLYTNGPEAFTIITPPTSYSRDVQASLQQIGPPRNPWNVVYILLESVRHDAITPAGTPHLFELAKESLNCRQAMAAGGFTHVSWNTLMLDRPAYSVYFDQHAEADTQGSWPIQVLKQAGYETSLCISTIFNYKGFQQGNRI